jgi:soluble lytic murein transglycosylase-like protein
MRTSRFTLTITLLALLSSFANARASQTGDGSLTAMIDRHAAAAGVPIALARAVVRIESNGNPRITGRAGEVGLMQIKHGTARAMGFGGSRAELYDPETNLRFGMRYLAEAVRLAGGDTCGALLRYQGGLGARRMTGAASTYCMQARRLMARN